MRQQLHPSLCPALTLPSWYTPLSASGTYPQIAMCYLPLLSWQIVHHTRHIPAKRQSNKLDLHKTTTNIEISSQSKDTQSVSYVLRFMNLACTVDECVAHRFSCPQSSLCLKQCFSHLHSFPLQQRYSRTAEFSILFNVLMLRFCTHGLVTRCLLVEI